LYERNFPLRRISRKVARDKVWITAEIKRSSSEKNKLYKHWLRTRKIEDLDKYKIYKNNFTKAVRLAKENYYANIFNFNKDRTRNTWQVLNTLCNPGKIKKDNLGIAQIKYNNILFTDPDNIANTLNHYFVNVGAYVEDGTLQPEGYF
jgi:hypothetical protein